MREDVNDFVYKCVPCNACKPHRIIKPPLDSRPTIMPRFHDIQIDIIGPLPPSEGMQYCLTVLDRTSRFFDALPMAKATTSACAEALIRGWISRFGLPQRAGSDNGVQFVSQVWQQLHQQLGSIVAFSPLYSSQSLGSVERQHRDLKQSLRATLMDMAEPHQSQWMAVIPWVLLARRTAYHSELQASPAEVVYGTQLRVPGDLPSADLTSGDTMPELLERLRVNARRPPAATTIRKEPTVYYPPTTETATHIYLRRPKTTPLSPT